MTDADDFRLDGKVALITGGARGIGAECARTLAASGASVMVTDILSDIGRATAASLGERGLRVAYRDLDVTSEEQWSAAIDSSIAIFGGFDVLVNNAGIEVMGAMWSTFSRQQQGIASSSPAPTAASS